MQSPIKIADQTEQAICAAICRSDGIKAREIATSIQSAHRTTALNPDAAVAEPIVGRSFAGMRR